ncbi:hypothetical protein Tco_0635080 [Tanacetum coccineum]
MCTVWNNRRITLIVIRALPTCPVVVPLMEFCLSCTYGNGNQIDFSTPYSFDQSPSFSHHPTHSKQILCEFCGNDTQYCHCCTPQSQFIYPEPDYSLDFNSPQDLHNLQQQNLCCENCRGPHATIECQPMSQNSHSFGFDQLQTPQFSVNHQPPQPMSMEALQAQEDLMKSIESFLKKFNRISFGKTPKVLLQAWDNFFEVKHAQSEEVQELLSKLVQDVNHNKTSYLVHQYSGLNRPPRLLLLYDNSSPRPPEALQANSNAIESLPPSHIPVADNDSLMEED